MHSESLSSGPPDSANITSRKSNTARRRVLLCAAALLAPLTAVVLFSSSGRDDSHITFWAAHMLATSGHILNYNGEAIEQSSSLLHLAILAAVQLVSGWGMVTVGKVVSLACAAVTVLLAASLAQRIDKAAAIPAAFLTATTPHFVYWSAGGLETTLVSAALVASALAIARYLGSGSLRNLAVMTAALASTQMLRPESPLVLGLASVTLAGVVFVANRAKAGLEAPPRIIVPCCIVIATSALLVMVRLALFGAAFPQPVTAKAGGADLHLRDGVDYLAQHLWSLHAPTAIATLISVVVVGVLLVAHARRLVASVELLSALAFVMSYLVFIVLTGGDWMEAGRFLAHITPLVMVIVAVSLRVTFRAPRARTVVAVSLTALGFAGSVAVARTESAGQTVWQRATVRLPESGRYSWFELRNRTNIRDLGTIDALDPVIRAVTTSGHTPVVLMSGQLGVVAYHTTARWYGHVRWVDRFGLVEDSLTGCAALDRIPRWRFGLRLSYGEFFALRAKCGIPLPDVIVDIAMADAVEANGYVVLFRQTGFVTVNGALPGGRVAAEEFIAVRRDLLPLIPGSVPVTVRLGEPREAPRE